MTPRNLRDKLARDRVMLENADRRTRVPRVDHNVFYNEVQKKLASRLFLSLGTEGKQRFLQKNPHAKNSKRSFWDITELAAVSFQKVKCVIYERYKLFTRMQEPDIKRAKPEKSLKQTAIAVDQNNEQSISTLDTSNKDVQSSSTLKTKQKAKQKKIDSETRRGNPRHVSIPKPGFC